MRVPDDRAPTRVARALAAARARQPLLDLTISNPTRAAIDYPAEPAATARAIRRRSTIVRTRSACTRRARPSPTRYARRGLASIGNGSCSHPAPVKRIPSCSSCSATPAVPDVLTPVPSYPLFDHLARLDGVGQRRYPLEYHGAWTIDRDVAGSRMDRPTRARCSPSARTIRPARCCTPRTRMSWRRAARRRGAALIVDEVFCGLSAGRGRSKSRPPCESPRCLAGAARRTVEERRVCRR